MGKNTEIAWTDHTWNPWQGCRKISAGCLYCYMFRDKKRYGQDPSIVVRSRPATFNAPLKWKNPARVFVCSWSDFFIVDADPWRDEAWEIIRITPHLTYQILTKRPENIIGRLPEGWPFKNVWLGVTTENQKMAEKRVPVLLSIPATIRFVSAEPMIGPVDFSRGLGFPCRNISQTCGMILKSDACSMGNCSGLRLDWVIVGGESGPDARRMKPVWALLLKQQCQETNTPFFMKQMSGKTPIPGFLQCREFPK